MWLHSLKVAQLLRSAACLHTNKSRSYLNHLVLNSKSSVSVACFLPGGAKDLSAPRGADKSLVRPTSRCILFDGENITFDASIVIYINSINIPPIMIISRIYEIQNLPSL